MDGDVWLMSGMHARVIMLNMALVLVFLWRCRIEVIRLCHFSCARATSSIRSPCTCVTVGGKKELFCVSTQSFVLQVRLLATRSGLFARVTDL